jgi:molecular chaperone HscB
MSKNAFALLGLSPCYDLDIQDLEQRYLRAQNTSHPDRFIHRSDLEKRVAIKQAADINQAYYALKCPLKRAQAFLEAKGISVPGKDGQTTQDPHLLMQVMEWQEMLLDASSLQDIAPLKTQLAHRLKEIVGEFDQASALALPTLYKELSYILKLQDEIKSKGL